MASVREKGSKIPVKIDLKPKNGSKIPLRVNQKATLSKPKIFAKTELKKTSVLDRNKKKPITEVKRSNVSSQVLKDRNKITAKEISKWVNPAQDNEKENSFEKGIPKMNMLYDDPFKANTEKKQVKNTNHPSQQNIEFVADERMKKLILSNRELTPSILKSSSNVKISSVMERPSLYKKLKIPPDPYKQALEDIATYDLASEGRRVSEMQKCPSYFSPARYRNSLYRPLKCVGDAYQDALRSIAELRLQQKSQVKCCKKKVTFHLSDDDQPCPEVKAVNHGEKPLSTIQTKLNETGVKSSESSNLLPSEFEKKKLLTPGNNLSKKVTFEVSSKPDEASKDKQINKETADLNQFKKEIDFLINKTSPSSLKTATNKEVANDFSRILHKQDTNKYTSIFNHEIKSSILKKTVNPFLDIMRTSEFRQSLFSNQSERFLDKMNPKICTPRPVSFYERTEPSENISPEFLSRRTTDILSCAPINTPLVLKTLARHELSPVCKKLEFKDSPKESKKEAGDSRENSQTFNLQNIMTQQKILDQLAHQECSIFMHEAEFPCEIRENLQNPIARILNDGDEMHFVPLWRLSYSPDRKKFGPVSLQRLG